MAEAGRQGAHRIYITADIAPDQNLIVLTANTRRPGDRMTPYVLYPVRTTFGFRGRRCCAPP
jgi:hypothetical protein